VSLLMLGNQGNMGVHTRMSGVSTPGGESDWWIHGGGTGKRFRCSVHGTIRVNLLRLGTAEK